MTTVEDDERNDEEITHVRAAVGSPRCQGSIPFWLLALVGAMSGQPVLITMGLIGFMTCVLILGLATWRRYLLDGE